MITTRFDHQEQVLYVHNQGSISIDELVNASNDYMLKVNRSKNLRILEFADAELARTPGKEWKKFLDVLNGWIQNFSSVRHAVISVDPHVVANVMLVQQEICHPNYDLNIFSTEKAARKWLSEH